MGWIWSSGPKPKQTATPDTTTTTTTTTKPTPDAEPTKQSTQDPTTDPEISKFLSQLQAELNTQTPPTTTPKSQTQPPQPNPPNPEPRLDPLSESLLPTTMSCRQAFDQAFHCNSLGGQWTAVYRAGTMRSCSEHWDDFWFCMRTRAYDSAAKEAAIQSHYRAKELRKYGPGMPSSTDVWEPRTERVAPDSVFRGGYVREDVSDEEWRRREILRRREIRRGLEEERGSS